jgi:hypothetical protein
MTWKGKPTLYNGVLDFNFSAISGLCYQDVKIILHSLYIF